MNLRYEQRLQVAAKIILDDDASSSDAPPSEEELGIRATLKPHQVEGVSWLIRRYKLGVNVVLGEILLTFQFSFLVDQNNYVIDFCFSVCLVSMLNWAKLIIEV
jgi:SNF2 family DNA or RNA helicase